MISYHDLPAPKLDAYDFKYGSLKPIHSYLTNRWHGKNLVLGKN